MPLSSRDAMAVVFTLFEQAITGATICFSSK